MKKKYGSDFKKIKATSEEEIKKHAEEDDMPILEEWPDDAKVILPQNKIPLSIRVDKYVMDYFKEEGNGYQTRINAVLRAYVDAKIKRRKHY